MCGLPAVCGEKLPGRRHKVRALCQAHADAVLGTQDPPWQRLDAKTQRDIVEDWLRAMTILAHGGHRPMGELLAEIGAVNDTSTGTIRLISPLMPGEARDLQQAIRAQNQLRSRETLVHAVVTQILRDWCATAARAVTCGAGSAGGARACRAASWRAEAPDRPARRCRRPGLFPPQARPVRPGAGACRAGARPGTAGPGREGRGGPCARPPARHRIAALSPRPGALGDRAALCA